MSKFGGAWSALIIAISLIGATVPGHASNRVSAASTETVTSCRQITALRDLSGSLKTSTNPRSGRTVEYLVVGDAAKSSQVLLFFNGTSQILPDWPTQMITNVSSSPLIASTIAFNKDEDSVSSLCHDYRLVFFDYPGVGLSHDSANYSEAQVVDDADAMLANAEQTYGISTSDVSVIGWSLGTEIALKFAVLDPIATPARTVHNVILIATKPGGGLSPQTSGNGAQCVDATFTALQNPGLSPTLRRKLEENNFKLIFPFQGEPPYDGPSINCEVTINTSTESVSLNVTPIACDLGTQCGKVAADWAANRLVPPWAAGGGVPFSVFNLQREQAFDLDYGYCASAGPNFTMSNCSSSQPIEQSPQNGGLCQTSSPPGFPNQPTATGCVAAPITGAITVINAPDDLYIQHVYGNALVNGYQQQFGSASANIVTYPGADGGGHGVLVQHPGWTQTQIAQALTIQNVSPPNATASALTPGGLPTANAIADPAQRANSTTATRETGPIGSDSCSPTPNVALQSNPCTPFFPSVSPATAATAILALCQTYSTLSQQQACIAGTLGNVGGFICAIGCAPSSGQAKPPAVPAQGRYCVLANGAKEWVVVGAPNPDGASC